MNVVMSLVVLFWLAFQEKTQSVIDSPGFFASHPPLPGALEACKDISNMEK